MFRAFQNLHNNLAVRSFVVRVETVHDPFSYTMLEWRCDPFGRKKRQCMTTQDDPRRIFIDMI